MAHAVEKFMKTANRPYSAGDVAQAMKDGKSAVQKSLDSLVAKGALTVKEYGKQKIYCAVQQDAVSSDDEDIDSKIQIAQSELSLLKCELSKEEAKMKTLNSSKTTEQLKIENDELNDKINQLQNKLKVFEKAENKLTGSQMGEVVKKWESSVKVYKKRKRIANDILDQILESYPKSKKHLYDDIGIEDDESVKMPKLSA